MILRWALGTVLIGLALLATVTYVIAMAERPSIGLGAETVVALALSLAAVVYAERLMR